MGESEWPSGRVRGVGLGNPIRWPLRMSTNSIHRHVIDQDQDQEKERFTQ